MRIEEEYKKTGYFWLPGKEENRIPGVLSIEDGGSIELEIVGHFNDPLHALGNEDDLSRIIGHVEKDGLVTLDHCFYTKKNLALGGISKSKIHANRMYSGAAWDEGEAVTFSSFAFSVDCLDNWVNISGINVDHDWEGSTATITYTPPEKIVLPLDNGMNLEICFAYTLPGFPNITEAKFTQQAYFKLTSEKLRDLDDFISAAFKITNLMCFAMDEVVTLKNVWATTPEIQRDGGNGKQYSTPISIYYKGIPFSEKVPKRNWHEMLFSFGAIKSDAQQVFNNWINAYEDLSPAMNLYFSTKAGAQKYLDGKFLALAQGLETYHRRTSSETLMDPKSFAALVEEVMKGCPDDHVAWLTGRLMHGNEINLGNRLKRIVEPFKQHLGTGAERKRIIRKISATRNYLTHYSKDLEEEAAKGMDLWVLCQKMEAIFNLHFLKVIGFTDEEIDSVINSSHPLNRRLKAI